MGRICWGIGELIGDGARVSVVFNGRATTPTRHRGCADFDRERAARRVGVGIIETEGVFGGWEIRLGVMRDFEVGDGWKYRKTG